MPNPRFWSGHLDETDLASTFKLPSTSIAQGQVTPDQIGMAVWNATGTDIAAGKLVYLSGWNATHSMPQVTLATASTPDTLAAFVSLGIIANGGSGLVGKHYTLTGQNTNSASAAGDAVYLGTTAGGYTVTSPSATAGFVQNVGRVAVKSATVGVIEFDLLAAPLIGAVTAIQAPFEPTTIPTTGSAEALFRCPVAGTLINFTVFGKDALATSDSNFIQFSGTNHGHVDGTGTTAMLNVASGNSSTKATGGQALVAYAGTSLVPSSTGANLVVAFGDVVALTATITGTLANTVTQAYGLMRILPASA
jgi:hypothetical protein